MHSSDEIDSAIEVVRQGDYLLQPSWKFFVVDLALAEAVDEKSSSHGGSPESSCEIRDCDDVVGVVVLTQTCDILRKSAERPYLELGALIEVSEAELPLIAKGSSPRYAFVPALAEKQLVVDLDRGMSVTKRAFAHDAANVSTGLYNDAERRAFATALRRKRGRHAFPKSISDAFSPFMAYVRKKHDKASEVGRFLAECEEVCIRVDPEISALSPEITVYFMFSQIPHEEEIDAYQKLADELVNRIALPKGWEHVQAVIQDFDRMSARLYLGLYKLDFEYLSTG